MPAKNKMPTSDQKRPSFPDNNTNMPADDNIPAKKQKRVKWNSYNAADELLAAPESRKDVEEYCSSPFYSTLGRLQVKCKFIIYLLQRNKNDLKLEKEEVNSLRITVSGQQILIDRIRETYEITTDK